MSFVNNPFKRLTLVTDDENKVVRWHCPGCGETSEVTWDIFAPFHAIRHNYDLHLGGHHNMHVKNVKRLNELWLND